MSFYTSLSGLQAAQTEMSTISHNLANVSTNGFKKSRTDFADVIASSVNLSPTQMVGSGVVVQGNKQQFGQGNMVASSNSLDLAISGDGFFAVKPSTSTAAINYTRNGSFQVDANHYVTDPQGSYLQVYPVDASGTATATGLGSAIALKLPETSGTAIATKAVTMTANLSANATVPATATFDRFDATSYNQSTNTQIYDAAGNALTMTTYFKRETVGDAANPTSNWAAYSYVGDTPLISGGSNRVPMTFDSSGKITAPTAATSFDAITPAGTTASQTISLDFGNRTTQVASAFTVSDRSQDGKAVGQLQGVTVDAKGVVKASFSNGDVQALGQVATVNFVNPAGLRQQGNSYWTATGVSGMPLAGTPGEDGLGEIMSGRIERSNVDITEELVDLIAAQRNFQANSKALDTANQISQTIFNIRS